MSKKRLSPDAVANELRGNSAFFPARDEARRQSTPETTDQQVFPPSSRTVEPTTATPADPPTLQSVLRTPVRPSRVITRYAFEFYQDQIETLRALSLGQKLQGQKGSMSEMVRDALDAYIAQLKRSEE